MHQKKNNNATAKVLRTSLGYTTGKNCAKFQVNPMKILRVIWHADLKNIVSRKTRLKFYIDLYICSKPVFTQEKGFGHLSNEWISILYTWKSTLR